MSLLLALKYSRFTRVETFKLNDICKTFYLIKTYDFHVGCYHLLNRQTFAMVTAVKH